jgi:hypothetical protein
MKTYSIEFKIPKNLWVTSNTAKNMHHHKLGIINRQLRELATWTGKALILSKRIPQFNKKVSEIEFRISIPSNNRFDPPNANACTKPLLDGLVDAGIFVDDNSGYIRKTSFIRGDTSPKDVYVIVATIYV